MRHRTDLSTVQHVDSISKAHIAMSSFSVIVRMKAQRSVVIADYVQSSGQSVDISQTFNYASGGTRPTSVVYEVFDTGGNKIMSQVFSN